MSFFSIWEPKTRTLRLANSGMPLPILVRQGRGHAIRAEGVPLGLLEHTDYQETVLTLEKGDLLALIIPAQAQDDLLVKAAKLEADESEMLASLKTRREVEHRYYREDFGHGVLPFLELAAIAGVDAPVADALYTLAEALVGTDLRAGGRTAITMGIAGLSRNDLVDLVRHP